MARVIKQVILSVDTDEFNL